MNKIPEAQPSRHLSKTRFMAGMQCPLRLYNDIYRRDLATPYSEVQQAIFDRGTAIGELAQQRYPGGVLVGHAPWERTEAVVETRKLLQDPSVPAIYEAAFEHQNVFVRVDILRRVENGWELIEVKAATRPDKEVFRLDTAIQYWVVAGAGLTISRAGVLVLNRDYVYPGGDYDLDELFVLGDTTEYCLDMQEDIGERVSGFHKMLAGGHPPSVGIGDHCFSPYTCPYYGSCTAGMVFPEHPVDHLYRLSIRQRDQLKAMGVATIPEVPEDFPLSPIQQRIREAVLTGNAWQSQDLKSELATAQWPRRYLDFEAYQPALPPYPGLRPFEALPFQFSLHTERSDGTLTHSEYLHEENSDPRRPLALALIDALGETGSIVVYSSYERRMIRLLAEQLPDLRQRLLVLEDRLWDLLPVVRNHFYHPDFGGSFSIKSVLPALLPNEGWGELEISDGQEAAVRYEQSLDSSGHDQRAGIFRDLKAYCRQDTLAMVRLFQALGKS